MGGGGGGGWKGSYSCNINFDLNRVNASFLLRFTTSDNKVNWGISWLTTVVTSIIIIVILVHQSSSLVTPNNNYSTRKPLLCKDG